MNNMSDIKDIYNNSNHYMDYVVVNDTHYYVSTTDTYDRGWETMVFLCDENDRVVDWMERYAHWYDDEDEAIKGHKDIVENLEKYI